MTDAPGGIGIFGGTFDPIHYGHLLLAETCRRVLQLSEVRLVVNSVSPHKTAADVTAAHLRADMVKLAVSGYPEFVTDRREIRRGGPSFTVETLREFRAEFPDRPLWFLMGADSLMDLPSWREPESIVELASVAAVNRPGFPLPDSRTLPSLIGARLAAAVRLIRMPGTDISSTELRTMAANGDPLRFLTPRAVEVLIQQHELYRQDT